MLTPDTINGVYEALGSVAIWLNVRRVVVDRGYAGVSVPTCAFFTSWGLWNLYYYPSLAQWASFAGGVSLALANVVWIAAMLNYGRMSHAQVEAIRDGIDEDWIHSRIGDGATAEEVFRER